MKKHRNFKPWTVYLGEPYESIMKKHWKKIVPDATPRTWRSMMIRKFVQEGLKRRGLIKKGK